MGPHPQTKRGAQKRRQVQSDDLRTAARRLDNQAELSLVLLMFGQLLLQFLNLSLDLFFRFDLFHQCLLSFRFLFVLVLLCSRTCRMSIVRN